MDRERLKAVWEGTRSLAGEVSFAGLKDLKAFQYGKELTNSARQTYLHCPQKYEYSYVYGLAPRRQSIPFLVGGLFHDELDKMYTAGELDAEGMAKRVAEACERACSTEGITAEDSDKIWMQQSIVKGMLTGYAALYLEKDMDAWEILETEGSFEVHLPGGWVYRGKKDMVIRNKKTNMVFLVEHKTTARLDAGYVAKLPMDNQILGYAWARREMIQQDPKAAKGMRPFAGVVYNVTKKPQIRQRQTETLAQYLKRVEEDYALNAGTYFYRETLTFSDADLDRFEKQLKLFISHIDRAHEEKSFIQNAGHCTAMGVCPFMSLCLNGVNKETLLHFRIKGRAHEELADAAPEEKE